MSFKGGERLLARLEEIKAKAGSGEVLRLGFLENATYPDGTPVAHIAAINEFGRPENNQPPRPYFRQMIAAKSPGWGASMAAVMKASDFDAVKSFRLMGEGIRGQLQDSIRTFVSPELSPVTIAKKGFDKPLIDTGNMLSSVDYEVKAEGGE